MNDFRPLLYVCALYGACIAGALRIRREPGSSMPAAKSLTMWRRPWATLFLVAAIAIPTTLQFAFPSLLLLLRRDAEAFRAGDWWRVVTPLFVQDGGVSGSAFNLLSLIVVGTVAERLWGSTRWLIIFFLGGIGSELVSLTWQPIGAGNSLANFSLAGSMGVLCLADRPLPHEGLAAVLCLGAGMWLLVIRDHHGAAVMIGGLIGVVLMCFNTVESGL